jgi:hypothetical protein
MRGIVCLPLHLDKRVHKTGTMPPESKSSERASQLPAFAKATASFTSIHSHHVQPPPYSSYLHQGNLEKDVFLLPILQPCHLRLSQGVSPLLLKAQRFLPQSPRSHQHSISQLLRINKNNRLTNLVAAPPKTLSPPTHPLRTHHPLSLSPNSKPCLPHASRPTPPTQRLLIHIITSPWHRAWTSTLQT